MKTSQVSKLKEKVQASTVTKKAKVRKPIRRKIAKSTQTAATQGDVPLRPVAGEATAQAVEIKATWDAFVGHLHRLKKQATIPTEYRIPAVAGGALMLCVLLVFTFTSFSNTSETSSQAAAAAGADLAAYNALADISQIMLLPAGEPRVLQIENAADLQQTQLFFQQARNGDLLMLYTDTAILYRPAINKIVGIGPVLQQPE